MLDCPCLAIVLTMSAVPAMTSKQRRGAQACALLTASWLACATESDPTPDEALDASQEAGEARGDAGYTQRGDAGTALPELLACAALGGAAPSRIADVVARINQLPAPASLPCLIASLPRPLSLVASTSVASLQPASGPDNPRIFILYPGLTLSVVPAGEGAHRLELGQWDLPERSLKAELRYPLALPVDELAPYQGLMNQSQTSSDCGFCHGGETRHETIPNAFVSQALSVFRYYELPLEEVRALRPACAVRTDAGAEPPGCLLLHAVFDHGEVRQGRFDPAVMQGF
jgi:hypothetical protein